MNKEEQIEEIAKTIADYKTIKNCDIRLIDNRDTPFLKFTHNSGIAETIYNLGYRKADEVRKETAREFLKNTKNLIAAFLISISLDRDFDINGAYEKLANEYGIEVK